MTVTTYITVISGGTGALGQELVRAFLADDHTVCVPYRDPEKFAALKNALPPAASLHGYHVPDWGDGAQVQACVAAITERFGRIDVLVNSSGLTRFSLLSDLEPDLWAAMFRHNLDPVYHSMRLVLPGMLARGFGRIVNVTSWKAEKGEAGLAAYSATKSGVNRLTQAAAAEIPADPAVDVAVTAVLPAKLNTERNRGLLPAEDPRHWVQLADVAAVVRFLASPAGRALNGACLPLYGKLFGREAAAPLMLGRKK